MLETVEVGYLYVSAICIVTGHNSMIYFVDDVGPSPLAQNVAFRDLPLRDVGQHPLWLYTRIQVIFCIILVILVT